MAAAVCRRADDVEEDGHSVDTTTMSPLRAAAHCTLHAAAAATSERSRVSKQRFSARRHCHYTGSLVSLELVLIPVPLYYLLKNIIIQRPCFKQFY